MSMIDQQLLTYLEGYLTDRRKEVFKEVLSKRTRHITVVLEDIYQQHNASAVLRSCDIFGIQDIHIIENRYVSKVSRHVAKGSQKWLTHYKYNSTQNNTLHCINSLKEKGYNVIATTPHIDSCELDSYDISKKSAFVFGVEKEGVSDDVLENADGFLKIPMVGFTESLNISVAAAIILQSLGEKLRKSPVNWQLTPKEQEVLYYEWVEKSIKNIDKIKAYYSTQVQNNKN